MRTAAALACLLLAPACGDDGKGEFPGRDVEPRWLLTASGESKGESIAVLPDGDVVVTIYVQGAPRAQIAIAGETYTLDEPGLLVLKLSAADGSVLASAELPDTGISRLIVAEDGDLVVGAYAPTEEGSGAYSVLRLSGEDLSVRWSRPLDITANISGVRVALDETGDVIAAHENQERLYVAKLSGVDGAILWTVEPVEGDTEASDAIALTGGDVMVVGHRHIGDQFENILLRLAGEDGSTIWQLDDADLGSDSIGEDLEVTGDGEILLASASMLSPNSLTLDTYVAGITPDGEVTWTRDICPGDLCYGTWPFPLLLRGSTAAMTIYDVDLDIVVQPFSTDGELDPPLAIASDWSDVLHGAALDGDGHLFLTGVTGQELMGDYEPGHAFILAL